MLYALVLVQFTKKYYFQHKLEVIFWLPKLDDFRIACYEYDRLYGRALADFVSKNLQTMV